MESEKQTTIRRFQYLPAKLRRLFRYTAATAALLLLYYSSFHIPTPPINSGDLLRRAAAILVSPRFVFFLGNAIILLLFAKSGQFSSSSESIWPELNSSCDAPYPALPHLEPIEEVACEEKKVCVEISAFRRSRSEKFERVREEPELRRAETAVSERGRRKGGSGSAHDRGDSEGEEDAEHFRRTIEEFIAKQRRFQMQESLAVVSFSAGLAEPFAEKNSVRISEN